MISPTPMARAQLRLRLALWAAVVMLFYAPAAVDAQGLVQGVQQGANAGNKAAGPVAACWEARSVGVVGVFTGVLGVGKTSNRPGERAETGRFSEERQSGQKAGKGSKQAVLTQDGAPQLNAEQIVANSDSNIDSDQDRIENSRPSRKSIGPGSTAQCITSAIMVPIVSTCELRVQSVIHRTISLSRCATKRSFLNDRAVDQRNVADAAEPLFARPRR